MDDYSKEICENQSTGDKIRCIRKRKGMKMKRLAEVCGVSSKTIQHYESACFFGRGKRVFLSFSFSYHTPRFLFSQPAAFL